MKSDTLSRNLRIARRIARYTQAAVAERLGVNHYTYVSWERSPGKAGAREPSSASIAKIATIYSLPAHLFYMEDEGQFRRSLNMTPDKRSIHQSDSSIAELRGSIVAEIALMDEGCLRIALAALHHIGQLEARQ
jgi:transcriptional regulator with XRE-family HTH domain